MTENKVIEIHCKQCKKHFFDYMIEFEENSDKEIVMHGICMKCDRCKRVITLKKYTQGYLISHSKKGIFKV
ncbi:hypothetical protein [Roseburia sp. 831b]|uniref:hypothetical protein n=1 Tax=Roseburia sp. 831b TaxID=1261635 RepID=UPI00095249A3|nr:hypothetical protein [Roseburia sp. 831b]WVK74139.1 hypothetical protein BIV16_06370 [Roseburia sp. 831b]